MWSEKLPYVAGWYWMRYKPRMHGPRSRIVHDPEIVEIFYEKNTSKQLMRQVGTSNQYALPTDAEWIGPLEPL